MSQVWPVGTKSWFCIDIDGGTINADSVVTMQHRGSNTHHQTELSFATTCRTCNLQKKHRTKLQHEGNKKKDSKQQQKNSSTQDEKFNSELKADVAIPNRYLKNTGNKNQAPAKADCWTWFYRPITLRTLVTRIKHLPKLTAERDSTGQ